MLPIFDWMKMKTQYEDKSTLTFINKKFILANNDPKNPVSIVRQTNKGDSTRVTVYLSNGKSFEDTIESLEDLIEISGNKAYNVTLFYDLTINVYEEASKENIEKAFTKFFSFGLEFKDEGEYLPVNQMIKRRLIPNNFFAILTMRGEDLEFSTSTGSIEISYYIISPPSCIQDIANLGEGSMSDAITGWIRNHFSDVSGVSFSNRNFSGCSIEETDISEALECAGADCINRTVLVEHATKKISVVARKSSEVKKLVSFFRK